MDRSKRLQENGPIAMQEGGSIAGSWDFGNYFRGGKPELFGVAEEAKGENASF